MQWPVVRGRKRTQPKTGSWNDWKEQIANDCGAACVYCAVAEGRLGGLRSFHVEHYRPKKRFPLLENSIENLYLACGICNVLKSDDWPGEPAPDHSVAAYPDPSTSDFNALFELKTSFDIDSPHASGKYLIARVMLNRAQLVIQRRLSAILRDKNDFDSWLEASIEDLEPQEAKEAIQAQLAFSKLVEPMLNARPYEDADTKRPLKPKAKRRRSKS